MKNENWKQGLSHELLFWDHWMETRGGTWKEDFFFRCDPDAALQDYICAYLNAPEGANVRILDVGAGPLTLLGKKWNGRSVELIATDALAKEYDYLLEKHEIVPPVRTIPVKAEELDGHFPANHFDLVHAQNCIDHCEHPLKVIENMLKLARPGAFVLLYHAVREGEREGYEGLHQWDFYSRENMFFIDGMGKSMDVSHHFSGMANVECHERITGCG